MSGVNEVPNLNSLRFYAENVGAEISTRSSPFTYVFLIFALTSICLFTLIFGINKWFTLLLIFFLIFVLKYTLKTFEKDPLKMTSEGFLTTVQQAILGHKGSVRLKDGDVLHFPVPSKTEKKEIEEIVLEGELKK